MLYVELDADGNARHMQYAPYLDYRPLNDDEPEVDALLGRRRPATLWQARAARQRCCFGPLPAIGRRSHQLTATARMFSILVAAIANRT